MRTLPSSKTGVIGLLTIIAGVVALRVSPAAARIMVVAGMFLLVCAGAGQGFRTLLVAARSDWASAGRVVRSHYRLWRRRARKATTAGNTVQLAWQLLALFYVLLMLIAALGIEGASSGGALHVAGSVGITVALADLCIMGIGVMRWPWGRSAGKWVKGAFAAVLACIALGMARQSLAEITGEDPSKFPATLGLMTALYIPLAWALVATVVASLILVPAMLLSLRRMTKDELSDAPGNYFLARCASAIRPVLLCLGVVQIGLLASPPDINAHPLLRYAGIVLLVQRDFWNQETCDGRPELAARVADNRFIVASTDDKGPELHPVACRPPATPGR